MSAEVELTDERLVSLSKDGNLAAFNSLVHRYESQVYTLCLRLLGSHQAAEDAAQEAFLSAYRALPTFSGTNFRSWLFRIAANQSKDEWRRRKRKDRASSLDELFDQFESPIDVPDTSAGVERLLEMKEVSEIVQRHPDDASGALQVRYQHIEPDLARKLAATDGTYGGVARALEEHIADQPTAAKVAALEAKRVELERGIERATQFSWERAARATEAHLQRVIAQGG